jgi:hypothetical protein
MNKKKIKILASLIVLGSTSFILSFLILPSRALAEEDEKKFNLVFNILEGFSFNFLSGFSIANLTPSKMDLDSSHLGSAGGFGFMYDVIEYISLGAGLMLIEKGGKFTRTVSENGRTLLVSTINTFNYLAIPIIVCFQANKAGLLEGSILPFVLFSLEPSFLLSASAETIFSVDGIETIKKKTEDITGDLESFDFGIGFGAGIIVIDFILIQVKYILGLTNIAKSGEVKMKNRAFVILLGPRLY